MRNVIVIDRQTKKKEEEKIMGHSMILALYGRSFTSKIIAPLLLWMTCRFHFVSKMYGLYQKTSFSKKNILPFIKSYKVNAKEFLDEPKNFKSFNDFFTRKLKKTTRPINPKAHVAIAPADARYLCFQHIDSTHDFWVKGRQFNLKTFLNDSKLARLYEGGTMVIARLCPSDYHRFHFPVSGICSKPKLINGALFSVNPIALYKNFLILQENKRSISFIESDYFGKVAYVEIGATNVGSIIQTYPALKTIHKGDEKGYFEFGGSCVVLLFEKGKIQLDQDLLENTMKGFETKVKMGESIGSKCND